MDNATIFIGTIVPSLKDVCAATFKGLVSLCCELSTGKPERM